MGYRTRILKMVSFSSLEFIFRFLPVFLILYYIVPCKYREIAFLAGSLIFYAVGEPVFILALVAATLLNYLFATLSWKVGEGFELHEWQKRRRKQFMIRAVVMDVAILTVFKLLGAFVDHSLLPLGISYYIFKMISFQVDLYRKKMWE